MIALHSRTGGGVQSIVWYSFLDKLGGTGNRLTGCNRCAQKYGTGIICWPVSTPQCSSIPLFLPVYRA